MSNIGQINSIQRVQSNNSNIRNNTSLEVEKTAITIKEDNLNIQSKKTNKSNDNIFFIGLNESSSSEISKLKKTASGKIESIVNTTNYEITLNKKKFNIVDTNAFKSLNLDTNTFNKLQNFLTNNFMFSISPSPFYPMRKEDFKKTIDEIGMPEKISNDFHNELATKTGAIYKDKSGKIYNFIFKEDIKDFSQSLGLSDSQSKEVEKLLSSKNVIPVAKEEVAQIISTFARAERGEDIPSRLVISSHSDGKSFFGVGDKGFLGKLDLATLKEISKIMPTAVEKIEDISISACNAGHSSHFEELKEIFPNLKTFMGYAGSAPGTDSGAEPHLKKWELLTRGNKDNLSPKDFQKFRKGENVSTWTEKEGFKLDSSKQMEKNIPEFISSSGYIIEDYLNDDKPVKDSQHGELRTVYTNIQLVLGNNKNLSTDDKKKLEHYRDSSLRLLFFTDISKKFTSNYSVQIEQGYKALDLKPTNFSNLSRSECRKEISTYKERLDALSKRMEHEVDKKLKSGGSESDIKGIKDSYSERISKAKELLNLLDNGLISLDPDIIPENWV
jgi:hypothetical protein